MNKIYPKVSVVVPVYNRIRLTTAFLQGFASVSYPNFEIVVVDDGSTDGTSQIIKNNFPSVHLLQTEGNLWWARATNLGASDAIERGTDYILTINDDVTFKYDFVDKLVMVAQLKPRTIIGALIYEHTNPKSLWYAGGRMAWLQGELIHRHSFDDGPLLWLTGMGTLIPVDIFKEMGFYDEKHFPQYAADADFTLRAHKRGFGLALAPESVIWNKAEESSQLIIRKNVALDNLLLPLVSWKSDSMLSMRIRLYCRHWPFFLIPIAFFAYYTKFIFKQILRLFKLR